jgi:hypothetical protein
MLKKSKKTIVQEIPTYDIIIIDEIQDMSLLYFRVLYRILVDVNNPDIQLCVLGDKNQSIFDFNGADSRFITRADDIFKYNDRRWEKLSLPVSFRVSQPMAMFINHCMLRRNRIEAHNKNTCIKPTYMICDGFIKSTNNMVYLFIKDMLDRGAKPEDIFVLAPSLKSSSSPVSILENILKNNQEDRSSIPIFVPASDDSKIDQDVIKNKLVFSTFHQSKGLERKIVIVYGFEDSYFTFYKKDHDPQICPNELYVACTRGSRHLVLVHQRNNGYLPFLDRERLSIYCNVYGNVVDENNKPKLSSTKHAILSPPKKLGVCDSIRHLSVDVIDYCFSRLEIINIKKSEKKISIPDKSIQKDNLYESLSDITGIALPMYFAYKLRPEDNQLETMISRCKDEKDQLIEEKEEENRKIINIHRKKIEQYDARNISIEQLLHIAIMYSCIQSTFVFKLDQIIHYDWVTENNLQIGMDRLHALDLTETGQFEKKVKNERQNIDFSGVMDYMDENSVYEFKCVAELTHEHYIQLALYKYLYESEFPNEPEKRYYLHNILTNEMNEIRCTFPILEEMVDYIIEQKYGKKEIQNDCLFFEKIHDIIQKESTN